MRTAPVSLTPTRTRLLDAATHVFRRQGYAGTSVEDICRQAGVTKGAFFHHFEGKEDLAVASTEHWTAVTGALFAQAPYHAHEDPRARVLAYVDFRADLVDGELADFTCLLGTLVQETFTSHPAIRAACERALQAHVSTLEDDFAQARRRHVPRSRWEPRELALYTQAALQGAFILAKAAQDPSIARACIAHLRAYLVALLTPATPRARPAAAARRRP